MSNKEIYSRTLGFSVRRLLYDILAFIVLGATALGYFLIPFAMKYLQATTVSIYTNLQPVVASVIAIILGQDILTWDKPVAGILVLLSAYIVTVVTAKE